MAQNYPSFDEEIIKQSIEAAQRHGEEAKLAASSAPAQLADGALLISAQCISVKVTNGKVCLNMPIGIGSV